AAAGNLDLVGTVADLFGKPRVELRGSGKDVPIDELLLQALRSFPAGANVTAALQPTAGRADADLYIRQPGGDDELVELDLQVRDAELAFLGFGAARRIGFPLSLTGVRGTVRLRDKSIRVDDVTARIGPAAGGGEVRCSGSVELDADGKDRIRIDVDAPAVQFSPEVRRALGYLLQDDGALWDQFAPAGSASVTVHIRPDDDPAGVWLVRVMPRDCTARYRRFPLAITSLAGEIRANPQGVEIDLQGLAGGGPATVRGRLLPATANDFAAGRLELHVHTERTAVDAELQSATTTLLPALTEVWDQFGPGGRCTADLALSRDGQAEPRYDLHLAMADGTLRPRPVSAAFADVHGEVYVHGADRDVQIEVDALRGHLVGPAVPPAEIAVVGTLGRGSSDHDDMTAVVRGLPLDEQLGLILNQLDALDTSTWSLLRPGGLVDVVLRWQRPEHSTMPHQHLTVHLRDVTSDAPMLPHRATRVTGQLEVTDGNVEFTDVHAQVGTAPVVCTAGHVRPAADGSKRKEVAFTVSAERFPLDEGLKNMFSGPLRQAVEDRQLRGNAKIKDLKLTFLLPLDNSKSLTTIVQGLFEPQDVQMLLGTRVLGISGVITVDESTVTTDGGGLAGSIENGSFQMFGHPCTDFRAGFTADADHMVFRNLAFALYGGAVRGRAGELPSIEYRLAPKPSEPGTLALDLNIQGVSLSELLRQSGVPPGLGYRGTLLGDVTVNELRGSDLVDMDAKGKLAVVDGFLGTVDVFKAIYALMPEANRPRFESGALSFVIKDRMVTLSDLKLRSPLVTVAGEGNMAMDGYLDVVLTVDRLFGPGADLTVLPLVLKWLASPLFRFHLFGYLRDLQVEQRWLIERDPRRRALAPVPALLEKAKRPGF
ncbi:MAG TPA: hypothetical protein VK348_10110, partial [Planctomycetota bacterium]|nr:hypothetical protein [Planctomycetota bacterium]